MSKNQKNRNRAVILHTVGIFVLLLIWLILIVFKNSLGSLKIPVFVGMLVVTVAGLYFLTKLLVKGLKH
ncbi:hypothetical protein [Lactovum odontotermitis]